MSEQPFTMDEVFDAAVAATNSTKADVISTGRTSSIVFARMVAIGCLRDLVVPSPSYSEIARVIGRRDHGTPLHHYKRWINDKDKDRFSYLVKRRVQEARRAASIL